MAIPSQGKGEQQEEFTLSGDKVVAKVKGLIREGNVRRIIIKNDKGEELMQMPLTIGVVGAVLVPTLAALGAVAALLTKCTIVVIKKE